ncbi:hypothetical protein ACFLW6_01340 [Chloroflexota bacterium]
MDNRQNILLWHPQVHDFFGENLYYFMLRFKGYNRNHLETLKQQLEKEGIVGFCLYEVFGEFDILMRIWLTLNGFHIINRILETFSNLMAYPFYRIIDQNHWAFTEYPNESNLQELLSNKSIIDTIQRQRSQENTKTIIEQYEKGNVLRYKPRSSGTKFYTTLTFGENGTISRRQEIEIKETMKRIQKDARSNQLEFKVKELSLYFCEQGIAHVLIKGVTDDVGGVRNLVVNQIIPETRGLFPETTTFVIAEEDPYESDDISTEALEKYSIGTPPLWIQLWFPNFYDIASDTSKLMTVQTILIDNRETIQSISEEHRLQVIKPLLEGVLSGQPENAIASILLWFARTEAFLGNEEIFIGYLRYLTGGQGKEVQEIHLEIKRKLGITKEEIGDKYITLGNKLEKYVEAVKRFTPNAELINITPQPAELTHIRNWFAHGEIFSNFDNEWQNIFKLFLWFLPLYESILSSIKTGISPDSQGEKV